MALYKFFKLKNKGMNDDTGFTLIELLVVVAIIGILSSVIVSSLSTIKLKTRDAKRISDLKQIKIALESYFLDNGYYPPSSCGWDCNGYSVSYSSSSWSSLSGHLLQYLPNGLPLDPVNSPCPPWTTTSDCFSYVYGNVGRSLHSPQYDLTARFEYEGHPLRCELRNYKFFFGSSISWCGSYPKYLYEASD